MRLLFFTQNNEKYLIFEDKKQKEWNGFIYENISSFMILLFSW